MANTKLLVLDETYPYSQSAKTMEQDINKLYPALWLAKTNTLLSYRDREYTTN